MERSLPELIRSATFMLLDREKPEQDLIYAIAKLDDEERMAIIMAYRNLYDFKKE